VKFDFARSGFCDRSWAFDASGITGSRKHGHQIVCEVMK